MKLQTITLALASMLGGLMLAGTPGMAESLAGKIGDKRSVVIFYQGEEGSCKQAYQNYIAAAASFRLCIDHQGLERHVFGLRRGFERAFAEGGRKSCAAELRRRRQKVQVQDSRALRDHGLEVAEPHRRGYVGRDYGIIDPAKTCETKIGV